MPEHGTGGKSPSEADPPEKPVAGAKKSGKKQTKITLNSNRC